MANIIITDQDQIGEVWRGMEVEDAARRAKALPTIAADLHSDLLRQLDFLHAAVAPKCDPDALDLLDTFFTRAKDRAAALAAIPEQATEVLTQSAFLVMQLMSQRNAKTRELAVLIEALERGDEKNPHLANFADRLDERRMDYTHLQESIGDEPADVMADMFLGRGGVSAEALGVLITALVGKFEQMTGCSVAITVTEPPQQEAQSA